MAVSRKQFGITLAGEINLDMILYGLPEELPVERELLATSFQMTLGSSSAIFAHNLAVLGTSVGFIGKVGGDELGQIALDRLGEGGVDLSRTIRPAVGTGAPGTGTGVTLLLPHGKVRRILTYPGTMAELTCADLDIDYLASAGHFHLSSLFLQTGLHEGLVPLLQDLKTRGLRISLDTNDDPADEWGGILDQVLPLVDILMPNESELLRIAKTATLADALAKIGSIVPLLIVKGGRARRARVSAWRQHDDPACHGHAGRHHRCRRQLQRRLPPCVPARQTAGVLRSRRQRDGRVVHPAAWWHGSLSRPGPVRILLATALAAQLTGRATSALVLPVRCQSITAVASTR